MYPYKERSDCRLCGGGLRLILDLGWTPLANELLDDPIASLNQERFPLYLSECKRCHHIQLPIVVDPERLFRQYPYVSGTSPVFVDHLHRQSRTLWTQHGLKHGDLVVEIGSNDGTLLRSFAGMGARVVGVDPARNLAELANRSGVTTIPKFFNVETAHEIRNQYGEAKLVVANNVFAHADNLGEIADAVSLLIGQKGTFVFEVGYLMDVVQKGLFDVAYHEHLSYHHVRPLLGFFSHRGLHVTNAERVDSQGGSIRVTVTRSNPWIRVNEGIYELLSQEPNGSVDVEALNFRIKAIRVQFRFAGEWGKVVAAYGSPAKAVTMTSVCKLPDWTIDFCVEDNPLKHGKYIPGTRIPIVGPERLGDAETCLVLGWNFSKSIVERHSEWKGRWIVPLPDWRMIDRREGVTQ